MRFFIDADACPVKDEVYRVAERFGALVEVVSGQPLRAPQSSMIRLTIVGDAFDAADDWIAERAGPGDIVITADIPLADRVLKAGAAAIDPRGRPFTADSIGVAMAQRALMEDLRAMGTVSGGPPPFSKRDRSNFLQALDKAAHAARRSPGGPATP